MRAMVAGILNVLTYVAAAFKQSKLIKNINGNSGLYLFFCLFPFIFYLQFNSFEGLWRFLSYRRTKCIIWFFNFYFIFLNVFPYSICLNLSPFPLFLSPPLSLSLPLPFLSLCPFLFYFISFITLFCYFFFKLSLQVSNITAPKQEFRLKNIN